MKSPASTAEELPVDVLIDGEAVGETLHAFDLLELKNTDIRDRPYLHRYAGLLILLDPEHPHLRPVSTMTHPADKQAMFETFKQPGSEGVVFKDFEAPFSPGRPASEGSQLKFKFVETASFIVTARNAKRSVYLGKRCDIPAGECVTDQLKYKAEPAAA